MNDPDLRQVLAKIEKRLAALEKHSHPPIDLAPAVRDLVRVEIERRR